MTGTETPLPLTQPPPVRPATGRSALMAPLVVAVGALGVVALLAVVDPNQPGHYPGCPFRAITGWDCPGCGTLRALHDLGTGDLGGALDHNLLAVLAIPFLGWAWVRWVRRLRNGQPPPPPHPAWLVRGLLVLILVWWVVRNLPWFGYLGSG